MFNILDNQPLNPSIQFELLIHPVDETRQRKFDITIRFYYLRCAILFFKLIADTFNIILYVVTQSQQTTQNCQILLGMFIFNDVWMVFQNLQLREGYSLPKMTPNNILINGCPNFYEKALIEQGKIEITRFHKSHPILIISTYLHTIFSAFVLYFVYYNFFDFYVIKDDSLINRYVLISFCLFLLGALIGITIPLIVAIYFYLLVIIYAVLRIVFDILTAIIVVGFIVGLSPLLCIILKCTSKDQIDRIEQRIRRSYEEVICQICQENFGPDDQVMRLPCFATHVFHIQCGQTYLQQAKKCPVCRAAVNNHQIINVFEMVQIEAQDKSACSLYSKYFYRKIRRRFLKICRSLRRFSYVQANMLQHLLIFFNYAGNV